MPLTIGDGIDDAHGQRAIAADVYSSDRLCRILCPRAARRRVRLHTTPRIIPEYSPKRRSVSTKCSLPHHARVADKCRSFDLFASIGGICRPRFTVPKYLGSMVASKPKPWMFDP